MRFDQRSDLLHCSYMHDFLCRSFLKRLHLSFKISVSTDVGEGFGSLRQTRALLVGWMHLENPSVALIEQLHRVNQGHKYFGDFVSLVPVRL